MTTAVRHRSSIHAGQASSSTKSLSSIAMTQRMGTIPISISRSVLPNSSTSAKPRDAVLRRSPSRDKNQHISNGTDDGALREVSSLPPRPLPPAPIPKNRVTATSKFVSPNNLEKFRPVAPEKARHQTSSRPVRVSLYTNSGGTGARVTSNTRAVVDTGRQEPVTLRNPAVLQTRKNQMAYNDIMTTPQIVRRSSSVSGDSRCAAALKLLNGNGPSTQDEKSVQGRSVPKTNGVRKVTKGNSLTKSDEQIDSSCSSTSSEMVPLSMDVRNHNVSESSSRKTATYRGTYDNRRLSLAEAHVDERGSDTKWSPKHRDAMEEKNRGIRNGTMVNSTMNRRDRKENRTIVKNDNESASIYDTPSKRRNGSKENITFQMDGMTIRDHDDYDDRLSTDTRKHIEVDEEGDSSHSWTSKSAPWTSDRRSTVLGGRSQNNNYERQEHENGASAVSRLREQTDSVSYVSSAGSVVCLTV